MANEAVQSKLMEALQADHVEIIDNSKLHAGHAAMAGKPRPAEGTHLQIIIVSSQFEGMPLLDRHRMVHQALKEAFDTHLHALELKTWTPAEWQERQPVTPS